ncbi:hypothetical protein LIER_26171 [Lithospermum erythrorhizon]|uniref:Uncharacterized protein n=1 Tax=Lithospermum erythrorhizon TaxID=34254 RepID=A0AAV3RBP7_LITER
MMVKNEVVPGDPDSPEDATEKEKPKAFPDVNVRAISNFPSHVFFDLVQASFKTFPSQRRVIWFFNVDGREKIPVNPMNRGALRTSPEEVRKNFVDLIKSCKRELVNSHRDLPVTTTTIQLMVLVSLTFHQAVNLKVNQPQLLMKQTGGVVALFEGKRSGWRGRMWKSSEESKESACHLEEEVSCDLLWFGVMVGEVVFIRILKGVKEVNGCIPEGFRVWKGTNPGVIKWSIKISKNVLVLILVVVVDMFKVVEEGTFSAMATMVD